MQSPFERSLASQPTLQDPLQDLQILSDRLRPIVSCQRWLRVVIVSFFLCVGLWIGGTERAIATPFTSMQNSVSGHSAVEISMERGAQIFQHTCTVCHAGGKNLIVPDKNLSLDALHRYGKDSVTAIIRQVTYGKGVMPAFGDGLSEADIANVATYVLNQAQENWGSSSISSSSSRKISNVAISQSGSDPEH